MKTKTRATLNISFLLVLSIAFLLSCTDGTIYHQYAAIDKDGWNKYAAAVFKADISDTVGDYNVIIDIRHRTDYPYQNLHLFVYSYSPDSVMMGDTLNCFLADNQGRWVGKGISSTKNLPILYLHNIKFPTPGVYTFEIKQGMRDDMLRGINDIGLSIQKTP